MSMMIMSVRPDCGPTSPYSAFPGHANQIVRLFWGSKSTVRGKVAAGPTNFH